MPIPSTAGLPDCTTDRLKASWQRPAAPVPRKIPVHDRLDCTECHRSATEAAQLFRNKSIQTAIVTPCWMEGQVRFPEGGKMPLP